MGFHDETLTENTHATGVGALVVTSNLRIKKSKRKEIKEK